MKKAPAKMKKKSMAKMAKKSPAKKPLVGKQKNLPEELKKKILASPAQMKKSAMKMKKESMAMMKKSVAMMKKASAMKMMGKDPSKKKTKMLKGTTVFGKEVNRKNIKKAINAADYLGVGKVTQPIYRKVKKKVVKGVKFLKK